jgi:hypothetical protein
MTGGKFVSEYDRFISVDEYAVFDVGAHGAGENYLFEVAAFADEIFYGVAVGDADYVLLDDGAVVEDFGDVVAGGANQFDPALEGLMVGARSDEGGQKGVVDVNDAMGMAVHEVVGQNLHIAGEHHEIRLVLVGQALDLRFGGVLVFFCDRYNYIRDPVEVGDWLIIRMV